MAKFSRHYCTFLPVLMALVNKTDGDVLELGTGVYSTPVLHFMCVPACRLLVSYEHDVRYLNRFAIREFEHEYHRVILVDDWDQADIERPWDVALVDHGPAERRKVEASRLAPHARYVIVHDSDWRNRKHCHYEEIYPLFKYRRDCRDRPWTTVLSNFEELDGLW